MKPRVFFTYLKLTLAAAGISATAMAYVVNDGDTLSSIAYTKISKKVYGDRGSLKKIILLNPKIKNPNLIFSGDEINILSDNDQLTDNSTTSSEAILILKPKNAVNSSKQPLAPKQSDSIQKQNRHGFYIGPMSFEVASLSAKDGAELSATATSNYVLGAGVGFGFDLSEAANMSINAKLKRYQFANFSSVAISDNSPTTFAFAVNFEKQTTQSLVLSANVGVEEILSLEPKSATQLDLKQLLSPQVGIGATYQIGDPSKWFKGFKIKANVDALLPAKGNTYTTKVGHKEQLKFLTVKDSEEGSRFSGGFTAYQQKFSTPFSETTQIGFGIEFSIDLEAANNKRPDKELVESEGTK